MCGSSFVQNTGDTGGNTRLKQICSWDDTANQCTAPFECCGRGGGVADQTCSPPPMLPPPSPLFPPPPPPTAPPQMEAGIIGAIAALSVLAVCFIGAAVFFVCRGRRAAVGQKLFSSGRLPKPGGDVTITSATSTAGPAGSESPSSSTKSNGPGFRVVWAGDEEERTGQRSGSLSSRVERVRVLGRGQQGAAVLMKDPITEELLVAKEVQIDGMSEDQRKGVENEVRRAAAPPAARRPPPTPRTSHLASSSAHR